MATQHGQPLLRVPFDSLTLYAVVAELRPLLIGGQIQDIRQPEPNELYLGIRNQGRNLILLLSADARFARVHLTSERKPNSVTPSSFCMALRRHIENGRITDVRQREFDRIFEMEIQSLAEDGTPSTVVLMAELMGKHSNLILVNARGAVVEAAKRISHRINRFRETLPGQPYHSPPVQTGRLSLLAPPMAAAALLSTLPVEETNLESLAERLTKEVAGMSPFLAQEIAYRTFASEDRSPDALVAAWDSTVGAVLHGSDQPCLLVQDSGKGAYPFQVRHFDGGKVTFNVRHLDSRKVTAAVTLNALLDIAYKSQVQRAGLAVALHDLDGRLDRERRKLDKQQHDAERTLQEGGRADDYQQQGELLLAHLWKIEHGAAQAAVQDFYSPEQTERTITLDPKLNPQENAHAYFRRAHKARDAQAQALTQSAGIQLRSQTLASALQQQQRNKENPEFSAVDARDFQRQLITDGVLREERSALATQPSGPDFQGHKIRRYTTPEGYEIYCGESATANDFLTTRIASPNDLWLHVRASAGSHVVIRTKGQPDKVPPAVLHRAATIAALHSNQKHSGLVPVDYTLRKHVRKPRGAAPGSVEVQREKTLHVAPHDDGEVR